MKRFTSDTFVLSLIMLSVVAVIASTAYMFLVQKDYVFWVEAVCNPEVEVCGYRDCSTGECPPNELEYYKNILVPADEFPKCSDNSCLKEIENETIQYEILECDPEWEECVSLSI